MTEEPELVTDRLHEAIHEEMEREGGALLDQQRLIGFGSIRMGIVGLVVLALARAH
ncbi:MAG TPA: hypothetical protein VLV15_16570 [Dongiaceae bacterium]|nr:hypothetical protein [Dongiaceae bacterium]